MIDSPAISVIIPNYNRAEQLRLAIASVLAQTYPVAEILVCDDGSSDHSQQVVSSFANPVLKWLACGQNGRPAIPRNTGIAAASSELVAFLDNDDTWAPDKLEKQLAALRKGCDMVCCNAIKISKGKPTEAMHAIPGDSLLNFYQLVSSNQVVCSSVLAKKSVLQKAGLFPEAKELKALEDYALWLRVSAFAKIQYLDACLVNYTDEVGTGIRKDSLSTAQQMNLIYRSFAAWYTHQGHYDTHYLELAKEVLVTRYLSDFRKKLSRLFS